jgi:hypothetical protein
MEETRRDEGLFAALFYFVYIPTYLYVSYISLMVVGGLIDKVSSTNNSLKLVQYLFLFVTTYFPVISVFFIYWGIKYRAKVRSKAWAASILWVLGWVLIFVAPFIILVLFAPEGY